MNAIIDEDLPRSFTTVLSNFGFTSFDIRDNMRGAADHEVYLFAQKKSAVLFSADLGFSNEMPVKIINNEVKLLLSKLTNKDYKGNLIILSPGKFFINSATGIAIDFLFGAW